MARLACPTPAYVAWARLDKIRVWCLGCSRRIAVADATVDLDGPAFKAYYCDACAAAAE